MGDGSPSKDRCLNHKEEGKKEAVSTRQAGSSWTSLPFLYALALRRRPRHEPPASKQYSALFTSKHHGMFHVSMCLISLLTLLQGPHTVAVGEGEVPEEWIPR